jgi:serine/threonine protein kinase
MKYLSRLILFLFLTAIFSPAGASEDLLTPPDFPDSEPEDQDDHNLSFSYQGRSKTMKLKVPENQAPYLLVTSTVDDPTYHKGRASEIEIVTALWQMKDHLPRHIAKILRVKGNSWRCEYFPGGNLRQLMQERPGILVREIYTIFSHSLEGLASMHEARMAHRNIKPENLVVDSYLVGGITRLAYIDFAAAVLPLVYANHDLSSCQFNTIRYQGIEDLCYINMVPGPGINPRLFKLLEKIQDEKCPLNSDDVQQIRAQVTKLGSGKDIWSLGLTLLEVLTWALNQEIPAKFFPHAHLKGFGLEKIAKDRELHRQLILFIDNLLPHESNRILDRENLGDSDFDLIKITLKSMLKYNPERRLPADAIWKQWKILSAPQE